MDQSFNFDTLNNTAVLFNTTEKIEIFERLTKIEAALTKICGSMSQVEAMNQLIMKNMKVEGVSNQNSDDKPCSCSCSKQSNVELARNLSKIDSIDSIKKFEEELGIDAFENTVKHYWTQRMDTDVGRGSGKKKIAFLLAEEMFSRDFFLLCSWTGSSASSEQKVITCVS